MNEIMKDLTGILMAIIGVAILYTLVAKKNNTSGVISAGAKGFSEILGQAMGN